jgi:tRNA threonylcarbamoyladenosine biosynthesis protein TsaB
MNYLLNIHTTSENAIVNLSDGDQVLSTLINSDSRRHAAFLHSSIHQILQGNDILSSLKAVGVTGGPGSYTGIRVGLATAKGLCFALKIPMIMMNTLELMAFSAIEKIANKNAFYCPMIDARRMEIFTAVYDVHLAPTIPPSAIVLEENSFRDLIQNHPVFFFGSGAEKFKKINNSNANYHFIDDQLSSFTLAKFAWNKFQKNEFDNIANSKAFYVKEFYSNFKIVKKK